MDMPLQTTVASAAATFAVFGIAATGYVASKRLTACAAGWRETLLMGVLFGGTALLAELVSAKVLPGAPIDGAPVALGLSAPFAGAAALLLATAMAAMFRLLLGGGDAFAAVAALIAAGGIGLLVLAFDRLRRGKRRIEQIGLLAVLLPFAALLGIVLTGHASGAAVGAAMGFAFVATLLFGGLLFYWLSLEEQLASAEGRFEALAANVPGVVFQCSLRAAGEIGFPYVSPECAELFHLRPEEITRDPARLLSMLHAEDAERFRRSLAEAAGEFKLWSQDFRIVDWAGGVRWLHGRAMPRRSADGTVVWHGAMVEISRRKEREEAFRRMERLYRAVADNTTDMIQIIAADGTRSYVSPAVRQMLGYEPGELVGEPVDALVHPEDIETVGALRRQLAGEARPAAATYRLRRKDGGYVAVSETCRLAEDAEGERARELVSVIRLAEGLSLGAAGGRQGPDAPFARALEAISAGVLMTNPHAADNPIIFANPAAAAITGYSVAEMLGRNCRMFQGADTDPESVAAIRRAVAEERPIAVTLLNYRRDGRAFWSRLHISPIHNSSKRLQAFVAVFFDLGDEQQQASQRRARQLAERAAAEFVSNLSHELRTPLNGVLGFTNLLLNENLPTEQRRYATFVRNAGRSLLAILNNSIDLTRVEAPAETAEVDFSIAELALGCNTVVWYAARDKGLDLNFVMKPDVIDAVRGHPDRLRQVLIDLLGNAVKFTSKGSVVLTIAKAEDLPGGTLLRISVADTGIGLAAEKQRRIFERGESGTGVLGEAGRGLALCKALVEQMGGAIGVSSTPGMGSEFWFTVPVKLAEAAAKPAPAAARKKGRILLAEDTPLNQDLVVTLLTRAGYEVEVVADGVAAVDAVQTRAFDLVLMDVQMPRLDGIKAAEAIRKLPGAAGAVPIVAVTAKAMPQEAERCLAAGMDDHVAKPIDGAALLQRIDHWLAAPPRPAKKAAAVAPAPGPVDRRVLDHVEQHQGSEQATKIVTIATKEIPERLERMLRQVSNRDRLQQDAHELASIASTLGLGELATHCRRLVDAPEEADDWQIGVMVENAKTAAERAIAVIRKAERAHAAE